MSSRTTSAKNSNAAGPATTNAPILLYGDNEFLKDERTRELIERGADAGTRAFNLDVFRGSEIDAGQLATALDALPLMAARRVVVVREFTALRKDAFAVLMRYLERPSAETMLVLVAPSGWKPDPAILGRCDPNECRVPSSDEALQWIADHATRLGTSIEPAAARALLQATGTDQAMLAGELGKLREFTGGKPMDSAAVAAVVGVSVGATPEDLIDLACARDGVGAARLAPLVLSLPKSSGVGLLLSLASHLLLMGQIVALQEAGVGPKQRASDIWATMKESPSSVVGRPWGAAVATVIRCGDLWDRDSIDRALYRLCMADQSLKESSLSTETQTVVDCLLTLGAPRRARPLAA